MKLYLDESVSAILAKVLMQHGIDCETARDAGQLGSSDEDQLRYATQAGRAILTHDTRDYLLLAQEWHRTRRPHAGIILVHQLPLRTLAQRARAFLIDYRSSDLANQVLWLPPPRESS